MFQIYERPTNEQLQETSGVLMHGKRQFCPGKHLQLCQLLPKYLLPGLVSFVSDVTNITVNVSSKSQSSDLDGLLGVGSVFSVLDLLAFFC